MTTSLFVVMVTALENQMEEFLFTNRWSPENVIWMRRKFSKLDLDSGNSVLGDYVDMSGENFNENAQVRLKNLCNKLTEKVGPDNKVELEVEWAGKGIDAAVPEHATYLGSLCKKYNEVLKQAVDKIMAKKQEQDRRRRKLVNRGKFIGAVMESFSGNHSQRMAFVLKMHGLCSRMAFVNLKVNDSLAACLKQYTSAHQLRDISLGWTLNAASIRQ